jgi:tRNA(Ile2) C34 agmatinyltransferase TiaS
MRQDQPHPVCPVACCVRSELEDALQNAERTMLQHLADFPLSQLTEQDVEGKVFMELKSFGNVHSAYT